MDVGDSEMDVTADEDDEASGGGGARSRREQQRQLVTGLLAGSLLPRRLHRRYYYYFERRPGEGRVGAGDVEGEEGEEAKDEDEDEAEEPHFWQPRRDRASDVERRRPSTANAVIASKGGAAGSRGTRQGFFSSPLAVTDRVCAPAVRSQSDLL